MNGETVLITGGNAGIGLETAKTLAKKGAEVIITSRSEEKGKQAVEAIRSHSGNQQVSFVALDLSSQAYVKAVADKVGQQHPKLDVLINNAGCFIGDKTINEDGLELQFATNHLGHFLLTNLLMPNLRAAINARIINLSSMAHTSVKELDLTDINFEKASYTSWGSYARSKLCNILFTRELGKRLEGAGVTSYAIHPGGVRTDIGAKNAPWYMKFGWHIMSPFMITVEKGAATSIYLASSAEVENNTGNYWHKCRQVNGSSLSRNMDLAAKLWNKSEELVGQTFL